MADLKGSTLQRPSPWQGFMKPGPYGNFAQGPGVTITPLANVSSVSVIARKGASLPDFDGVAFPETGMWSGSSGKRIAADGPGQWRVVARDLPEGELYRDVKAAVESAASVVDQSHGWVSVRIAGDAAPDVLAKGSSIDFHLDSFGPGQCASTQIHHMIVHLTCLDDEGPTYEIQLFRSMAGTFANWLRDSAAAFGCQYE